MTVATLKKMILGDVRRRQAAHVPWSRFCDVFGYAAEVDEFSALRLLRPDLMAWVFKNHLEASVVLDDKSRVAGVTFTPMRRMTEASAQ